MSDIIQLQELETELSFLNLIQNKKIVIPKIQRDYAQGRLDVKASEIRDGFVSALIDTLRSDSPKALVLDFIYGSTHSDSSFVPLDGQQRLTTLFLLHWYLASDENLDKLKWKNTSSEFSRFAYETRISSKDFCDALVKNSYSTIKKLFRNKIESIEEQIINLKEDENFAEDIDKRNEAIGLENELKMLTITKVIKDQAFFLWNWRMDPTVQAMLVMLDELESKFGVFNDVDRRKMWDRLEDKKIVFHLLPLEQFGLTDELYVKMNARGKELSGFDILKSSLEEQMRLNKVSQEIQDEWRNNVDSRWVDMFWNKLAKPFLTDDVKVEDQLKYVDAVEDGYLNFLKGMMVFHLFTNTDCLSCDWEDEHIKRYVPFKYDDSSNILIRIRDYSVQNDVLSLMPLFLKANFFNQKYFEFVITSIESLIYKTNGFNYDGSGLIDGVDFEKSEKTIFESFVADSIKYETRLQFFALLQFFKYNSAKVVSTTDALKEELTAWMRIIRNLTVLSNIFLDSPRQFEETLKVFGSWANRIYKDSLEKSIIKYLKEARIGNDLPRGRFASMQTEEEVIKAKLISEPVDGGKWLSLIKKAEEHKFLLGQIRFLLDWCKTESGYDFEAFSLYYLKIDNIFDHDGLRGELRNETTHFFRNALMIDTGFYLLDDSFVNSTGKERDKSWKSYFRDSKKSENIKNLLDKWDIKLHSNFSDFYEKKLSGNKNGITDWRKCFINIPKIYNRCSKNSIAFWNKDKMEICLLETSSTWVGTNVHSELFTYYWYNKFIDKPGWKANYINSQSANPLCSTFRKGDNDVAVSFTVVNDYGEYYLCLNFNPNIKNITFKQENSKWEKYFDSNQHNEVEQILGSILSNRLEQ